MNMPAYCFDFNVYKQANVNMVIIIIDLGSTIESFKERYRFYTTTITYIHARSADPGNFRRGWRWGGGVQARLTEKKSEVFFL